MISTAVLTGLALASSLPPNLETAVHASRALTSAQRIDQLSGVLLGAQYALDPLGEGVAPDTDPMVRYDAFDCLTYVEEVLALSLSTTPTEADAIRSAMRYGANPPAYTSRHHFMSLQWLPVNIAQGYLTDIGERFGTTTPLRKTVDDRIWNTWNGRSRFQHTDEELPRGPMALNVLPLEKAIERAQDIPTGTLVLTVREDWWWRPIWVSHVGFVIQSPEGPRVRHATTLGDDGVREHSLTWYLEHIAQYKNPPVLGVALYEAHRRETTPKKAE